MLIILVNIRIDSLTNKRETKLLGLVPPKKGEQFQVPPSTDVYIVKILILYIKLEISAQKG